jgi:hypothetical protein
VFVTPDMDTETGVRVAVEELMRDSFFSFSVLFFSFFSAAISTDGVDENLRKNNICKVILFAEFNFLIQISFAQI